MPHAKFGQDLLNNVAMHKEQRNRQTHRQFNDNEL